MKLPQAFLILGLGITGLTIVALEYTAFELSIGNTLDLWGAFVFHYLIYPYFLFPPVAFVYYFWKTSLKQWSGRLSLALLTLVYYVFPFFFFFFVIIGVVGLSPGFDFFIELFAISPSLCLLTGWGLAYAEKTRLEPISPKLRIVRDACLGVNIALPLVAIPVLTSGQLTQPGPIGDGAFISISFFFFYGLWVAPLVFFIYFSSSIRSRRKMVILSLVEALSYGAINVTLILTGATFSLPPFLTGLFFGLAPIPTLIIGFLFSRADWQSATADWL